MSKQKLESNQEIIKNIIQTFPGLRFNEIKKEGSIANGTLQHHLSSLEKLGQISIDYDNSTPRYFFKEIDSDSRIIIKRLNQVTPSRIIKLLLKKECQTFSQIVKYSKKSPGTVSLYKNKMGADKIIVGTTDGCKYCKNRGNMKIKYRLVDPEKVRTLVIEFGKSSLSKSADNLADIFLSLR